jgi:hypothetical protein
LSIEGFVRGHRVARILGIAVPLVIVLVWWGIWGGQGNVARVTTVSGVVMQDDGKTCLVRAGTGQTVRILCPGTRKKGELLKLRQTLYESGELRYALAP